MDKEHNIKKINIKGDITVRLIKIVYKYKCSCDRKQI